MKKEYITNSDKETRELGEKIAREILSKKAKKNAFVIGLKGELGGGKTTFLQGFAKGIGIKEKILSPTFIILKRFSAQGGPASGGQNFYHFDCYRIQISKELLDLGFEKIISDSKNIVAVEWADRIKKIMPKNTIWINFKFIDKNKRQINVLK